MRIGEVFGAQAWIVLCGWVGFLVGEGIKAMMKGMPRGCWGGHDGEVATLSSAKNGMEAEFDWLLGGEEPSVGVCSGNEDG